MLVRRGMGGWFDSVTSFGSDVVHAATAMATRPFDSLDRLGGAAIGAAGTAAVQGFQTVGQVGSSIGGALPKGVPGAGGSSAPALALPPSSNTPLILGGLAVAAVLGFVLLRRPRAAAPAVAGG